jgi:hypothetical protein
VTPALHRAAAGPEARGDRFHFIARQIERLDDRAFAALLAWLDGYADSRWAGRCAMDGGVASTMAASAASVAIDRRAGVAPASPREMRAADACTADTRTTGTRTTDTHKSGARKRDMYAAEWPTLAWIACEPTAPQGHAPSRARR